MAERISRRDFLKSAGAATAGAAVGYVLGCGKVVDLEQAATPTAKPMIKPTFEPTPGTTETPRVIITPDSQAFDNFLPIRTDSLGGTSFKEFIGNPDKLIDAWTVEGSIYTRWFKTETLESIKYAPVNFLPRWSTHEEISNARLDTPKIIKEYGRDTTAIILNSGGAHSLAMAYELVRDGGWQPVPMLRGIPCKSCATFGADQDAAVALYPAKEMLGITVRLPKNAPPAFIWDAHRNSLPMPGGVDNRYSFKLTDMPSADFLRSRGIANIIYVNEAKDPTIKPWENKGYDYDWAQILASYQNNGLKVFWLGISPSQ